MAQGVEVLRSADRGADFGRNLQQADLPHALEVRSDGVGVQAERVGDVSRGQRLGRPGQLQVDGVPGVVAEGLQ